MSTATRVTDDVWQRALGRALKQNLRITIDPNQVHGYLVASGRADEGNGPYNVFVCDDGHWTSCNCQGATSYGYCKHQALVQYTLGWLQEVA